MRPRARIPNIAPRLKTLNTDGARAIPKTTDPHYLTPAHQAWREQVIARAGRRCQAVENGTRCPKSEPQYRMFADHIVERSDGGAPFDLANGQCLCGAHHKRKTDRERARRACSLPAL